MPGYEWQVTDQRIYIDRMPLLMGIVNATPDSFSDGGSYDPVEHALNLLADGADILDIGGESTRPGSSPVTETEELNRVIPVIESIRKQTPALISIDTTKAAVAREAIAAGAAILNDVSALSADAAMLELAAATSVGIIAMHRQGTPQTMQLNPHYDDVVSEVTNYLKLRLSAFKEAGIAPQRVALDPGIGFGKRTEHNLQLLSHLDRLLEPGRPLCLGVSRKGFINRLLGRQGHAEHGDHGTVGVMTHALARGWVQIARIHNVKAFHDAATLFLELENHRTQD